MKQHYLFIALLCLGILAGIGAPAQTPRVDSLKIVLQGQKDSLSRLRTLLALCGQKESVPGDTLLGYARRAQYIAGKLDDKPHLLLANYYILLSLANKGKLDTVLAEDNRVLKTLSYDNDRDLYTKYLIQRSRVYIKRARYQEAQQDAGNLLQKAMAAHDVAGSVYSLTYIGWTWMEMEKPALALDWFHKAEAEIDASPLPLDYSPLYSNIAAVYDDLNQHDSALVYVRKAIASSEKSQSLSYLANALAIQSDIYVHLLRTAEAEASMSRAIAIRRQIGDPFYMISDMGALAYLYSRNKKTAEGIAICREGLALAREYHFGTKLLYLNEALAENYKAAADYKNYSATLDTIMALKDSAFKNNSQQALADMEAKYETQKKENTIIEQKFKLTQQRYIVYGLTIIIILCLAIMTVLFEVRRHKQRLREAELNTENRRQQQLAVDRTREEERKRILADLHDELGSGLSSIRIMSDLMANGHALAPETVTKHARRISEISRNTSQGMNTIIWALNNDNDTINNLYEYIGRFGEGLFENSGIQFSIDLAPGVPDVSLSGAHRKSIFLCVKESLHNVLKHSGAGAVRVSFYQQRGMLCIVVKDNGGGKADNLSTKLGNGIRNMNRRMQEINGKTYYSSDGGLSVHFEIPLD